MLAFYTRLDSPDNFGTPFQGLLGIRGRLLNKTLASNSLRQVAQKYLTPYLIPTFSIERQRRHENISDV